MKARGMARPSARRARHQHEFAATAQAHSRVVLRADRVDSRCLNQLIQVLEIDEHAVGGFAVGDAAFVDEPAEEAFGGPLVARLFGDLGEVDVSVVHAPVLPARIEAGDIEVRSSPEKDVLQLAVS